MFGRRMYGCEKMGDAASPIDFVGLPCLSSTKHYFMLEHNDSMQWMDESLGLKGSQKCTPEQLIFEIRPKTIEISRNFSQKWGSVQPLTQEQFVLQIHKTVFSKRRGGGGGGGGGGSKNELARLCKNLACKTCLACARDILSLFLHDSCTYLARNGERFCKSCCKNNYLHFLHIFCKIMACKNWCKIVQESCKQRDISRACAKQVLHARFLQDSCTILHDLASSFLLGESGPPGHPLDLPLFRLVKVLF